MVGVASGAARGDLGPCRRHGPSVGFSVGVGASESLQARRAIKGLWIRKSFPKDVSAPNISPLLSKKAGCNNPLLI